MSAVHELLETWRRQAEVFRQWGRPDAADMLEEAARQVEGALTADADSLLSLDEAAAASGYSKRRLRELLADGRLENRGRKGAPRIRRADLPHRSPASPPHLAGSSFDARAEAESILRRRSA